MWIESFCVPQFTLCWFLRIFKSTASKISVIFVKSICYKLKFLQKTLAKIWATEIFISFHTVLKIHWVILDVPSLWSSIIFCKKNTNFSIISIELHWEYRNPRKSSLISEIGNLKSKKVGTFNIVFELLYHLK